MHSNSISENILFLVCGLGILQGILLAALVFSLAAFSQPTHVFTDPEKKFKAAKELFVIQQYALAVLPLLQLRRHQQTILLINGN